MDSTKLDKLIKAFTKEIKEDLEDTLDNIKEFREGFIAKYGVNLWRFLITLGVIAILAIIF